MKEGKKFIIKKNTYIGGERWSENSKVETTYYVGKEYIEDKEVDKYSKNMDDACVFNSNRHRTELRGPNPFRRQDITKEFVDEDFVNRQKKTTEKKNERLFSRLINRIVNKLSIRTIKES